MKVAIIGGKLQGTEAVYLASVCGIESILIDKDPKVPASGLADRFVCGDVVAGDSQVLEAMREADFVLPANENDALLEAICRICEEEELKLAFDLRAYRLTQSKRRSDQLFHENGIPAPAYYPQGKPPYIMKPSGESGSAGVTYAASRQEVENFLDQLGEDRENWIVQEFVTGPSYSIEVIGVPGNYRTYAITQIHMDQAYDCCMVTAPCPLTEEKETYFAELAVKLAELVQLSGIMDVEVIDDGKDLKVLEIDARIPSQTPITVYYSSGMNLLAELADLTITGDFVSEQKNQRRCSAYEHYGRIGGRIVREGEHMMTQAAPLHLSDACCGSRRILWDLDPKEKGGDFRGIFINWEDSREELEQRRENILRNLKTLP